MNRYINADKLKHNWLFRGKDGEPYRATIDEQPTADVVPKERYDRLLENANILSETVSEYQEKIEIERGEKDGI